MTRPHREANVHGEPIGHLIRRVRRQRGLSQYRLATALVTVSGNPSLTREHVSRWERGRYIPRPYWRGWLAAVLVLAESQLEHAANVARRHQLELNDPLATENAEPDQGDRIT